MSGSALDLVYIASTWVLPVLIAITMHEAAHGYVAWRLGDDTAYRQGRVSFNPLRHVDSFGTIILPAILLLTRAPFLFGWAKPVPVAFDRLRQPRRDMVLVAAAGPASNLILATISTVLIHVAVLLPFALSGWFVANLLNSIVINLVLAVFNMLPLPPLDGGRVAVGLLPRPLAWRLARLERFGLLILIAIMFLLPYVAGQMGYNLEIFHVMIWTPVEFLRDFLLQTAGIV